MCILGKLSCLFICCFLLSENIKVRFFEIDDQGHEIWSDYGQFSDFDVHHQYAIVFRYGPSKYIVITVFGKFMICFYFFLRFFFFCRV